MDDKNYDNLCLNGQILWEKHELMRIKFQNANSIDCFRYEEHLKKCDICKEALGLDNDFFTVKV